VIVLRCNDEVPWLLVCRRGRPSRCFEKAHELLGFDRLFGERSRTPASLKKIVDGNTCLGKILNHRYRHDELDLQFS